ncbi:MAG: hypothetical protein Kow0069_08820 [Promethearchaeota archaeon]
MVKIQAQVRNLPKVAIQATLDPVLVLDDRLRFVWANERFVEEFTRDGGADGLRERTCHEIAWGLDSPCANCALVAERASQERPYSKQRLAWGGKTWDVRCAPIVEGGKVVGVLSQIVDMTEEAKLQSALRQHERVLSLVNEVTTRAIEASGLAAFWRGACELLTSALDLDFVLVYSIEEGGRGERPRLVHSAGRSSGAVESLAATVADSLFEDLLPALGRFELACFDDFSGRLGLDDPGLKFAAVVPLVHHELGGALVLCRGAREFGDEEKSLLVAAGKVLGAAVQRVALRERLVATKNNLERLFESIQEMVFVIGPNDEILATNGAVLATLGHANQELKRTRYWELFPPGERLTAQVRLERALEGYSTAWQAPMTNSSGTEVDVETKFAKGVWNGRPAIFAVARDVSFRKIREESVLQTKKLESVALLAGGIAHDFRNILQGLVGNLSLLRDQSPEGADWNRLLAEMEDDLARAVQLTDQLLAFAKGSTPVKRRVKVPEVLEPATSLSVRGSNVRLKVEVPPDLWPVEADPSQLAQCFGNLALNAVQAMPNGGTLEVVARNARVPHGEEKHPLLPRGDYVVVQFSDEGVGIPRENLSRVFDPYFTTKPGGTGLGLAVVHTIVRQHGGHVRVESRVGKGSTFTLYFPAAARERKGGGEEAGRSKEREGAGEPGTKSGEGEFAGTALVMDDEPAVRRVLERMLKRLGFDVLTAGDGAEAVEKFREAKERGNTPAIVLVDLTVPGGFGGKQVVDHVKALDPTVPVVISSGYSSDSVMANYERHGFDGVLVKPYLFDDLKNLLSRLLT